MPASRWRGGWGKRREGRSAPFRAVIGLAEIDGVLVDAVEKEPRHLGEARLGVAHGSRVIAVDIAEIALAVDQRVADGEILRQADQRVIDRLVAMRMVFADDVADDARRFLVARAGIEAELPHGVEHAAMHRLQPIAEIGQSPVHDGRKGIGEIALLERAAQIDGLDGAARNHFVSHALAVSFCVRRAKRERLPRAAPWEGGRPRPPFREIANATLRRGKWRARTPALPGSARVAKPPPTARNGVLRGRRRRTDRERRCGICPPGSCALSKARKAGSFSYRDCTAAGDMVNILPQCGRG